MKTNYVSLFFLQIIVPKLGLAKLSDDELDGYAQDKLDALNGNPNFPTTDPKVADVQKALDKYRTDLAAAKDGNKADTVQKNASRKALEEQLTLLSYDVAKQSNGDLTIYTTSHFDYRQRGGKVPPLDVPQNFRLSFTKYDGELKAICKKVKGASTYEFRLTVDATKPVKDWEMSVTTTSTRTLFTGLESGKRYYGVARSIGAAGKISDWSDQADKICP